MPKPIRAIMKNISKKQIHKNTELNIIKKKRVKKCFICGHYGDDLAHLLPRSLFPEHVINPDNLVIMCRDCHNLHDNDVSYRMSQRNCYLQACLVDELGANRYYIK
jgi:5-methylcytosine-specific restriction endonuclease McrA